MKFPLEKLTKSWCKQPTKTLRRVLVSSKEFVWPHYFGHGTGKSEVSFLLFFFFFFQRFYSYVKKTQKFSKTCWLDVQSCNLKFQYRWILLLFFLKKKWMFMIKIPESWTAGSKRKSVDFPNIFVECTDGVCFRLSCRDNHFPFRKSSNSVSLPQH